MLINACNKCIRTIPLTYICFRHTLLHSHSWCLLGCRSLSDVCLLNLHEMYLNRIQLHSWCVAELHKHDAHQTHICTPTSVCSLSKTHTVLHMLSCVTVSDWPHLSYVTALCGALPALWCLRVTGRVNVSKCAWASIVCSITTEWFISNMPLH